MFMVILIAGLAAAAGIGTWYSWKRAKERRAALAATVVTYRARSAVRDVGKALGLDPIFVDDLAKSLSWWDKQRDLEKRFAEHGLDTLRGAPGGP